MHLSHFNIDDTSCYLGEWEAILDDYQAAIDDEEFWRFAKCSDSLPHFGNLYQYLVIYRLIDRFCQDLGIEQDSSMLKFDYFVNAIDTHFSINDVPIQSKKDWYQLRDELEKQIGDPDLLN